MSTFKRLITNVAKLFLIIIESDKKCEIRKEVLCEIKEFEPFQIFEQLKKQNFEGSLPLTTLYNFLNANDVFVTTSELENYFRFIKTKNSRQILYSEFLQAILPNKKQKLRQKVLVRQLNHSENSSKSNILSIKDSDTTTARNYKKKTVCNIDFALSQVFDLEIRLFRLVEIMKQKMFENKQAVNNDLNLIQAYNTIDKDRKGSINRQDLLKFLNKFVKNAQFTMDDIINLFRRLNIDEDDRIGYLQFMNLILPSQKQELNEDLIVKQRESRSLDRVSNYQNARQTKVYRERFKENDFNKRKSTYQDEFNSKNYSSFNSISKINTTASSKKRQTTNIGKDRQVFSSNMRTVNTPSKFTTAQKRQSTSKEKNQTKFSLRYNEIRDLKSNISKSFDQSKSSNVSKYKQTRFKKSQIKQEPIKESKLQKYQDQKTPRSRSKSRLEQTKKFRIFFFI